MPEKIKVLMIGTASPPVTGQSVAFDMLVTGLRDRYHLTILNISERGTRRDKTFSIGRMFQIIRTFFSALWRASSSDVSYLTIAQSRWGFLRDAVLILAIRALGKPVVVHLHGGNYLGFYNREPALVRKLIRHVMVRVDRFIVLSSNLVDQFSFLGPEGDARVRVVPNGSPVEIGVSRRLQAGCVRLLYLSNLLVEKGYLDIIDALPHLKRLLPGTKVQLTLAGAFLLGQDNYDSQADMERAFRKHVDYLDVTAEVEYLGVVEGQTKERLLAQHDILLLPTYYINEGQPLAVIEGCAQGMPIVTTAWRGVVDMVADGENGVIVDARAPLAIAEAVAGLVRDPSRYEAMSLAALMRARRFSVEQYLSGVAQVLEEVCEGRK